MNLNRKRPIYRLVRGLAIVLLTAGATTGIILGSLTLSKWTKTSPAFNLDTIVVTGNMNVGKEDIVTISGLERGRNIWSANLAAIERRLMLDRRFAHVALTRRLPGTVVVWVKELQPVAFVQLNRLYGVTERAELIPLSPGNGLPDLPVITVGAPGDHPAQDNTTRQDQVFETLRDAMLVNPEVGRALYLMRVLRTLSPGLYDELSEVHVSSQHDPIAYMVEGGLAIRFGTGHYPRKIEMLKRTVDRLEADAIRTRLIDLRFKDQVIVRPIVSARSPERRS
ncbi:MAG: FtsQ-type POTRA domain-containing protein [Gemmatimonadetes bacterium]|nr:FtsQ-type POTRA domain-containing protein [Gemmatimonadota bacterium]